MFWHFFRYIYHTVYIITIKLSILYIFNCNDFIFTLVIKLRTFKYLSELSKVRITTLTHKPHEMGNCVAETMMRMLQGIPVVSQEIPWELVRKESDGPAHL